MKKINRIITVALLTVLSYAVQAQQPIGYNLYTLNPFLLNPAYMGQNDCINGFINSNNKWTDLNDAPSANTLGVHSNFGNNASIGGMVVSDKRSMVSYITANLMYAYHVKLNNNQKLSFGLNLGVANNSLNTDKVQVKDKNDPLFTTFNSTCLDAGFGALYAINSFKFGASVPHFFDQTGNFSNQINVQGSYDHFLKNKEWKLTPILMARNYNAVGLVYDAHLMATWKETIMAQVGYRTDQSLIAGVGFNWKSLAISYAYQYNTGSTYNAFSGSGTQEIMLAFKICKKKDKPVADKPNPNAEKVNVNVNMTDEKYKQPVPGNIVIKQGSAVRFSGSADQSGVSSFYLEPGVYTVEIAAKGYVPIEDQIDLSASAKGSKYNYELKPTKLEKGLVFKLKTVNFETGSDKLAKSSYQILDKMAQMLSENPQMVLEVAGYTDNVGDDNLNLKLSEKRANSVASYLTSKGARASQMKAVGYGEVNPIADNNTEEGRLQNRRVMFTVLEF